MEDKLFRLGIAAQSVMQVTAKRLNNREIDASVGGVHCYAVHKVEEAVAAFHVVVFAVEVVEAHKVKQLGVFYLVRQIGVRQLAHPRFVVVILHLEHKIVAVELVGAKRIDVFHHQVPVRIFWGEVAAFQ